ncbi:glycosyltransferase family 2 protein [Microbacterium sp.]|uniref:glycosyltransferase family 2 protein n=1 Tax=Microbacterium sp. TaxID=51671 RepID=UPI003A8FE162
MLKVSVVVPTYKPGAGLDRLVASLDAQTLSRDEFEVIFVDDGSPDDTYSRLQEIARTRSHVRVERIENSGWPSKPRNVGTDLARGEYVAYMDHDDELYPDALRLGYAFAAANASDVVSGKEARTHDAAWAIDLYREDVGQASGMVRQHPMIPMNPHKLYRRAFLLEHDIRFPEGGRVMWEDIFFNLQVMRHARVVSVLASVPYYHWFTTSGSGSTGFQRSNPDFWLWLRRVFEATQEELDGPEFALQLRQQMGHQYRSRVIASFDTRFAGRPAAERDLIYNGCLRLQRDFGLDRFDDALNASGRMRAQLLRTERRELLEELPGLDPMIPGWGMAQSLRWRGDTLQVTADVEWSSPRGRRHDLQLTADGRIVKQLPDRLAAVLPERLRDVTDEIGTATVELGMRSRQTRVVWMLPSRADVRAVEHAGGGVALSATLAAELDVTSAVFGSPVGDDTWDLNVRTNLGGSVTQTPLRGRNPATVSLRDDAVRLAYVNKDGFVTVEADNATEAVRRVAPRSIQATDGVLEIALEGVHDGTGRVPVSIDVMGVGGRVRAGVSAHLVVDEGRASLQLSEAPKNARLRIGDRAPGGAAWWTVRSGASGVRFERGPSQRAQSSGPQPERSSIRRRLRRIAGQTLRRLGLRR